LYFLESYNDFDGRNEYFEGIYTSVKKFVDKEEVRRGQE